MEDMFNFSFPDHGWKISFFFRFKDSNGFSDDVLSDNSEDIQSDNEGGRSTTNIMNEEPASHQEPTSNDEGPIGEWKPHHNQQ